MFTDVNDVTYSTKVELIAKMFYKIKSKMVRKLKYCKPVLI